MAVKHTRIRHLVFAALFINPVPEGLRRRNRLKGMIGNRSCRYGVGQVAGRAGSDFIAMAGMFLGIGDDIFMALPA